MSVCLSSEAGVDERRGWSVRHGWSSWSDVRLEDERRGDVRHGWRVCEAWLEVTHGWSVVGVIRVIMLDDRRGGYKPSQTGQLTA